MNLHAAADRLVESFSGGSQSTLVAIVLLLVTISVWIPDPGSCESSISWLRTTDGVRVTTTYTLGFLATVSASCGPA